MSLDGTPPDDGRKIDPAKPEAKPVWRTGDTQVGLFGTAHTRLVMPELAVRPRVTKLYMHHHTTMPYPTFAGVPSHLEGIQSLPRLKTAYIDQGLLAIPDK
ncbi:hypothetical protein FRB90_010349, partial [Tulasnella sp. 427]